MCPDDGIPKILSLMVFVALHNSNPSITHFPFLRDGVLEPRIWLHDNCRVRCLFAKERRDRRDFCGQGFTTTVFYHDAATHQ